MADTERTYEHYVFQDLDLVGNNIKNVRNVSSDEELTLNGTKAVIKPSLDVEGDTYIKSSGNNAFKVKGKSTFEDNVEIGSTTQRDKSLTLSGIKVSWDDNTQSLIFENTNQSSNS